MKIRFSADPVVAHETNGLAVRYAASKRQIANWRWRILVLFVLAPLLIFLARLAYGAVWADMPGFVAIDEAVLKTPVTGRLVSFVSVGQQVKAGDVIAQLRNDILEQEYASLLDSRNAKVANQSTAPTMSSSPQPRRMSQRNAEQAKGLFDLRRQQYVNLAQLSEQGAATQAEVITAYASMQQAQRDIPQQAARQGKPMQTAATAALPDLDAPRLAEKAAMVESLTIRATENGTVAQIYGKQGEWIGAGAEVASLRLQRTPSIEVFVEPSWAKYATPKSWATVNFLDGYSHRAQVIHVKMQAQRLPPDRANPLTVRHHSVVVLLEPAEGLPEQYRVNVLPVNVQFDREFAIEKLAFWRHIGKERVANAQ